MLGRARTSFVVMLDVESRRLERCCLPFQTWIFQVSPHEPHGSAVGRATSQRRRESHNREEHRVFGYLSRIPFFGDRYVGAQSSPRTAPEHGGEPGAVSAPVRFVLRLATERVDVGLTLPSCVVEPDATAWPSRRRGLAIAGCILASPSGRGATSASSSGSVRQRRQSWRGRRQLRRQLRRWARGLGPRPSSDRHRLSVGDRTMTSPLRSKVALRPPPSRRYPWRLSPQRHERLASPTLGRPLLVWCMSKGSKNSFRRPLRPVRAEFGRMFAS